MKNKSKYDFQVSGLGITRVQYGVPINEAISNIGHDLTYIDFNKVTITITKRKVYKKLDKSRMNGIFVICSQLPVIDDERYDIVPNEFYEYSLVLRNCNSDNERIMIRDEDPDSFCKKILEYRNKVLQ